MGVGVDPDLLQDHHVGGLDDLLAELGVLRAKGVDCGLELGRAAGGAGAAGMGGGKAATWAVHAAPSHHRIWDASLGSGYQPAGVTS